MAMSLVRYRCVSVTSSGIITYLIKFFDCSDKHSHSPFSLHQYTCVYTFTHWDITHWDMFGFKQKQLPSEDSIYVYSWMWTCYFQAGVYVYISCDVDTLIKAARKLHQEWGPKHQGLGTSSRMCLVTNITVYAWKVKWILLLACSIIG
jgi:hypothetical protein